MNRALFTYIIFLSLFYNTYAQYKDSLCSQPASRTEIIIYETGVGILFTVGTFFPAGLIIGTMSHSEGLGGTIATFFIASSIALTFGGSYGVYSIDKNYNKNASYLIALGGSFVGYSLSYYLLTKDGDPIRGFEAVTAVIAPLVFSVLAVNLIDFERIEINVGINYQPVLRYNTIQHNIKMRIKF